MRVTRSCVDPAAVSRVALGGDQAAHGGGGGDSPLSIEPKWLLVGNSNCLTDWRHDETSLTTAQSTLTNEILIGKLGEEKKITVVPPKEDIPHDHEKDKPKRTESDIATGFLLLFADLFLLFSFAFQISSPLVWFWSLTVNLLFPLSFCFSLKEIAGEDETHDDPGPLCAACVCLSE